MITRDTITKDAFALPELKELRKFMIYDGKNQDYDNLPPDHEYYKPISFRDSLGNSADSIVEGLNFLSECRKAGRADIHFVAPESDANFIRITPEKIDPEKPYIILCSGGAYFCVCTYIESIPTAKHFVEAGYQVFVMTYRVSESGTLPVALDDIAAVIRYAKAHETEFRLDGDNYAIGGYSAGANLISNWGLSTVGYKSYGLPRPKAMFPIYTLVDFSYITQDCQEDFIVMKMLGKDYTLTLLHKYDVLRHLDADYPPCYLVCGKDDSVVPCRNSELFDELLSRFKVPHVLEEAEHAPHGFGDGTGTDVEGWPERALKFLEAQK
ncbi:MAG: alpha/beta hydrolase [Treponemataceae bacterium]|nr:alpha/beta hydrolase [Treponemataceae bacterium]